jgi:arabinoxylan arabinofuranohydrolase
MHKIFESPLPLLTFSGLFSLGISLSISDARADNPIVQHVYTADPAPMVHEDTVYLCTSHDEDVTVDDFFTMNDWFVFSSKDMVNWTDHGTPVSWETFSWAGPNKSWAPHCVARDDKFYIYVPVDDKIGVAVADSPTGPFTDAIGAPLLSNYQYIDPTVFIDDDGQAYLYFGNPKLWYVKLNEDMITMDGGVQEIPMTTQGFGERRGGATQDRPSAYEEGPWFYKRNDLHYMVYPTGELPEHIAYSTSPEATGPWSYGGEIMDSVSGHAFTNHPGVIDFKGRSYFFYHTQELPGGGGFKRSDAIEEFTYNPDGSIPAINKTSEGVTESAEPLVPYYRVEGETLAWGEGIEVEDCTEGGRDVSSIESNDAIKVEAVDFLTGAVSFEASVASAGAGGSIELHLDSKMGQLLGTCEVGPTGGWQIWTTVSCDVETTAGVHDLFLVFKGDGGSLFNLDWWRFEPLDPLPAGSGGGDGSGGSPVDGSGGLDAGTGGVESHAGGAPGATGGVLGSTGGVTATAGGADSDLGSGGVLTTGIGGTIDGEPSASGGAPTGGEPPTEDAVNSDQPGCSFATSPGEGNAPWPWLIFGGLMLGLRRKGRIFRFPRERRFVGIVRAVR